MTKIEFKDNKKGLGRAPTLTRLSCRDKTFHESLFDFWSALPTILGNTPFLGLLRDANCIDFWINHSGYKLTQSSLLIIGDLVVTQSYKEVMTQS